MYYLIFDIYHEIKELSKKKGIITFAYSLGFMNYINMLPEEELFKTVPKNGVIEPFIEMEGLRALQIDTHTKKRKKVINLAQKKHKPTHGKH